MACFHCEHKRPPDEFTENKKQGRERGPRPRLEKVANRTGISNAWNFNFDEDESDGADVAAFEYADSPRMGQDTPLEDRDQGGNFRGLDNDFNRGSRHPGGRERLNQDPDVSRPRMGFDDFDDEDDDVESYELDTSSSNPAQKTSSIDFSELEEYSGSEDIEGFDENFPGHNRTKSSKSSKYDKSSRPVHRKAALSSMEDDELDFDSDDELSVNPKWKSSHVADSKQRGRSATGPSKGLSFGSDEELRLGSDSDDDLRRDFGSQSKRKRWGSSRRENSDTDNGHFSGSGSNDDDTFPYRSRANKEVPDRRHNNSRSRGGFDTAGDSRFRSNSMRGGRRNSFNDDFDRSSKGSGGRNGGRDGRRNSFDDDFGRSSRGSGGRNTGRGGGRNSFNDDFDRSSRGSRGRNGGGFRGDDYDRPRLSNRGGDFRDSNGPRGRKRFGNGQGGRDSNRSDKDWDYDQDRPRRQRIIER